VEGTRRKAIDMLKRANGLSKGKDWKYVKALKGATLPEGLAIIEDELNAVYYIIAPAFDRRLSSFKKLQSFTNIFIKEVV